MGVSIVVPTLNAGEHAFALREALASQRLRPLEVVIMDSASTDGTPEQWQGARVIGIERRDFDHGGTRNLGARECRGDVLVFMTQDALPVGDRWLEDLISSVVSGEAAAAFARQLPREDADPLERFARTFNYPARSRIRDIRDIRNLGVKAYFFSNVCSAVRADVFWEVGGFREGVIFNEDLMLCANLLRAGYKVKYESEACVYHSHGYDLLQQFKRNFDNGVSFAQAGALLVGAHTTREGARFVVGQAGYVWRHGSMLDFVRVFAEAAIKLLAYNLGRNERYLPRTLKRRLSMHDGFWT